MSERMRHSLIVHFNEGATLFVPRLSEALWRRLKENTSGVLDPRQVISIPRDRSQFNIPISRVRYLEFIRRPEREYIEEAERLEARKRNLAQVYTSRDAEASYPLRGKA